jgi:dihydrofolate reductase
MARIVGYIATSLDGFIVDANGSLEWLYTAPFELGEHHYDEFIKTIRTVVMGRATYDWMANQPGMAWPYSKQRTIVVTSKPLRDPVGPLETRSDVDGLIAELRALDDGNVWMLGGGALQMAFMERGALDEIEIYIAPRITGGGAPLFPATGFRANPRLISAKPLGGGVRLHYAFDQPA